jgi:hypothetical protein
MYTLTRLTARACARPLSTAFGRRLYATAGADSIPKSRKVFDSADDAVKDIQSGSTVLSGGMFCLPTTSIYIRPSIYFILLVSRRCIPGLCLV